MAWEIVTSRVCNQCVGASGVQLRTGRSRWHLPVAAAVLSAAEAGVQNGSFDRRKLFYFCVG